MKKIVWLIVVALCTGCSLKLREAHVELPEKYIYSSHFNNTDSLMGDRWWQSFNDTTLNSLVERALQNNRNLIAATSAVEQARYYLRVARSEFMPSLSTDLTAEVIHELETTEQEYTAAPTIEWEVSLFGALRNAKRSAVAAILLEEWNMRGVTLALTAEVATAYFTLLQYQRSLQIATRSYELRCTATALVDSLYHYGMSNGTDLMQAKSLVYSANIEMQSYQRAVATTSLSLSILLGDTPQMPPPHCNQTALSSIRLPFDIPVGLPSTLLERRPDVMKSYYAMAKAAAEVGVRRANRYPTITITGAGGVYATSLEGLT
ncbi:MAG: TolC family protein, partial [Rikenellaceae bacterium]